MALTKTVDPDARIPCATAEELERELSKLEDALAVEEGEDTWEKLERAVIRFAGITRGGGYKHTAAYVEGVGRKRNGLRLVQCMLSDRGRLSGAATDLLATMAPRLALHFAPLALLYLPPIIKLLARPNKVFLRRSEKCLHLIVSHCPVPAIIPLIMDGVQDKNEGCRRACAVAVQEIVNKWEKPVMGKHMADIEGAMKRMATDKDPECRKAGKAVWERYKVVWPERVDSFSEPLTPTTKRYLDIKAGTGAAPRKAAVPPAPRTASATVLHRESAPIAGPSQPAARVVVARVPSASAVSTARPSKPATETPLGMSTNRPIANRTVSTSVTERSRPLAAADLVPQGPIHATHSRSQSSSTTSEPAVPPSATRSAGGMGKPVRPAMAHASSSSLSASSGPTRRPGALGAAVRPPVRMPSSKSLKGVAEGGELQSMLSAAVRAQRAARGPGEEAKAVLSVERMRKIPAKTNENAISSAPQSPSPKTGKATASPQIVQPRTGSVLAHKPSKPVQARVGVGRAHAAFRPVTRDTKQALAAKAAKSYTGPVAKVPKSAVVGSPVKKETVARVRNVAQVHDPTAVSAPEAVREPPTVSAASAPPLGVQLAVETLEDDADEMPAGEDATCRLSNAPADPTIVVAAQPPMGEGTGTPAEQDDGTQAKDVQDAEAPSALANAKPVRTNIFAPPTHTDFMVPVGEGLAPKDIPLPPSPRQEGEPDVSGSHARQLRHQPSIAHSIDAASSNGTVAADWDDERASTDGEPEDSMMGVSFKTPARRGQPIKEALLKRIAARSAAEEAEARARGSPSSDLLQFSEEDALSNSSRSSGGGGVSPKVAAIAQLLLKKSTNTMHSPVRAESENNSAPKSAPRRGFTPVRHDRPLVRPGSTTPADTPPAARKLLSKSVSNKDAGQNRPAVVGRWH